jgi:glutathione synthase/RimK-type ligase-like ATP-grasp enzyme
MQTPILGICHRPGSFSDRWIEYCTEKKIPFRVVDALSPSLIQETRGLRAFLWHWHHCDYASQLVARQILRALEMAGLVVFPDVNTCWHYDDKVGQKYLLEAIGAPLVPTWVFYRLEEALAWIQIADFPKVFKLRNGAGSANVRLVRHRRQARRLCRRAFSRGFRPVPAYCSDFRTKVKNTLASGQVWQKIKRAPRAIGHLHRQSRIFPSERGYVYFQEYLPGNTRDMRVNIVGGRAFGFSRRNRPGDFRASGSGCAEHAPELIDLKAIEEAFRIAERIGSQSLALDFLYDSNHRHALLEISCAFCLELVQGCPGYWDRSLAWHPGPILPQDLILEDVLVEVRQDLARTGPKKVPICLAGQSGFPASSKAV